MDEKLQIVSRIGSIREWLVLCAAAASAIFAGLIWWLARKRLKTRYVLTIEGFGSDAATLHGKIAIHNRSDDQIRIETISVKPPLKLLVDGRGAVYGRGRSAGPYKTAQQGPYDWIIEPESLAGREIVLARDGGFSGCKEISIRLHILSSFPVIRHRKKVLTAILPASMRKAQI